MAKGTITLSGSTVGTKMESLEVEQGATGGVAGLFKVDNNDTDKVAMSIEASNIDADVIDITADALTTQSGLYMSADALTTGTALFIDSDSSSTGTRNIAWVRQNHASATGSTALSLQSDAGRGLFIDSNLAAGGYALEIDSEITTANTVMLNSICTSGTILEIFAGGVLTGTIIAVAADSATTGKGINISMDGLTTGSALYIDSDSSSTSARNIVEIIQNNASATSAVGLKVQQDGDAPAAVFEGSNVYVRQGSALQTLTTSALVMGG